MSKVYKTNLKRKEMKYEKININTVYAIALALMLMLAFTVRLTAQTFSVGLYQDVRLAIAKDVLGNKPPILDMIVNGKIYGKLFFGEVSYEYADMSQPFSRISTGGGVYYRYKFMEISQGFNYGVILRPFSKTLSLGSNTECAIIIKQFKIMGLIQVTKRTEWGDMIRFSGFIGIGYNFKNKKK